MELLKRYSISFAIAGLLLYFFTIWVEKKHEASMPHNLSTKNEEIVSIQLKPKRYFEKCVDLRPVQQLEYGFNANGALSFNLHYHEEGEQHYPVKEDSVSELEKTFQAEKRGYYCLKWGNPGSEDIEMDYHFKILNASAVSE
jgi:hypothetical protein